MTKEELILYIKKRDRYYQGWYIGDYSYGTLLKIKEKIEYELKDLPRGYMLYSNGKICETIK